MKKLVLAILIPLSGNVFAESYSLKPGLWELKTVRQVMDGRDMMAQMAAAQTQMQQAMANMPAAQRSQMEKMMGGKPGSAGGAYRICISPEMAARNKPMVDSEGRCEPAKVSRNGNKTSFEFRCSGQGRTEVGKGVSTATGDMVETRLDMTMTDAQGSHSMQSESQMRFIGTDCQGIKPADQLVGEARGVGGRK